MIRSISMAAAMTVTVTLVGCAADTTEPEPESTTPASSPANEDAVPNVDTSKVDTQAVFYCTGPRPICAWPDIAVCTSGTLRKPGRWHCP